MIHATKKDLYDLFDYDVNVDNENVCVLDLEYPAAEALKKISRAKYEEYFNDWLGDAVYNNMIYVVDDNKYLVEE